MWKNTIISILALASGVTTSYVLPEIATYRSTPLTRSSQARSNDYAWACCHRHAVQGVGWPRLNLLGGLAGVLHWRDDLFHCGCGKHLGETAHVRILHGDLIGDLLLGIVGSG